MAWFNSGNDRPVKNMETLANQINQLPSMILPLKIEATNKYMCIQNTGSRLHSTEFFKFNLINSHTKHTL